MTRHALSNVLPIAPDEATLLSLFDGVLDAPLPLAAAAMFDRRMCYLAASRRWRQDYGLGDRELAGLSHYDIFPEIGERWKRLHQRALAGEFLSAEEDAFPRADGTVQWVRWVMLPWRSTGGGVGGIVIFAEDITERKVMETALRESEQRLRLAQQAGKVGTWEWDVMTGRNHWSAETFRLLGLDPDTASASYDAWMTTVRPADREAVDRRARAAWRQRGEFVADWRKAGEEWCWLTVRGQPEFDANGRLRRYLGIVQDITEHKHAERALENTRDMLAEAERIAGLGSFEYDIAQQTTVASEEQCRIYGLDPALPSPDFDTVISTCLFPEDADELRQQFLATVAQGGEFDREHRIRRPDGSARWVRTRARLYREESGKPARYVGMTLDLTELHQAEETTRNHLDEIARMHRLHTADELASFLAHELNQPLATITNYATVCQQTLEKQAPEAEKLRDVAQRIKQQAMRAGDIIKHLRRFIARGNVVPEAVDLNAVICNARELMRPSGRRKNIRIGLDLAPDLPAVMGVEVQLEQVLLNLLRNAFDAINEQAETKGSVMISSHWRENMAELTVTDSGPGIDPEQAEHLFDGVCSHKENGLGLGLRISRSLVEAHGGRLWVEPQVPGAIFHIDLPLAT